MVKITGKLEVLNQKNWKNKIYTNKGTLNMKQYVKLFENFINESNETIKAQGACKNAMFILQKDINNLLKRMSDIGILANYSTKIEIYNSGYELKITTSVNRDYAKNDDKSPVSEFALSFINMNSYIFLQPGSFFGDYLEQNKGAYIEGKILQLDKNTSGVYPRYDIKAKADIDKVAKDFIETVRKQVAEVYKKLEVNESVDRSGLVGNYAEYQNTNQSMAKFSIGDKVKCVNGANECFGRLGKIVAFEDAYVRWEVENSETGIGQTAVQYRCLAEELESATEIQTVAVTVTAEPKK